MHANSLEFDKQDSVGEKSRMTHDILPKPVEQRDAKKITSVSMQKARQIFRHSSLQYEKHVRSKPQPWNKYSTRVMHDKLKKLVHKEKEREEFDQAKKLAEEAK